MNIALDYDGTYTSDPELWLRFIADAKARGHELRVVTMRFMSEGSSIDPKLLATGVPIVYTNRMAKAPHCERIIGWVPHVWIDDHPEAVHRSAHEIWNTPAPEGSPVVPQYE